MLEREANLKKGGLPALYDFTVSSITFTLCVGKAKFSLLLVFLRSFGLAMQDCLQNLYSIKLLYHLYISDPFWQCAENNDYLIKISLEYTENCTDQFF